MRFLAVLLSRIPLFAAAQTYPARPIRMLVPLAVGGTGDVLATLHAAAVKSIIKPAVRERLQQQGADLAGSTPGEFRKLIESEVVTWNRIARQIQARVD